MRKIKVAAVQMNALIDDLEHNLAVHRHFAGRAAKGGCDLVMFPELSATAHYGDPKATQFGEQAGKGQVYEALWALARQLNLVIGYGFCEVARGTYYNSFALVGPSGLLGVQRKTHASTDEYLHFRMGRELEVFDLGFCKVGALICYDSDFFEAWRVVALKGADVVLLPHASRNGRGKRIPTDKQIRSLRNIYKRLPDKRGNYAGDNCVFAVFANQIDYNGHSTHSGGAYVIAPDGSLMAKSRASLDNLMVTAELDPGLLRKARNRAGATLKTRRPEIYGELVRAE